MGANHGMIVPPHIQKKLETSAQAQSQASWVIADCALEVFNSYITRRDAGDRLFLTIEEGDVWRALAHYAGKSPSRVRGLYYVAQQVPIWIREMYEPRWEFGYFERIVQSPYDPGEVFEFLEDYLDGTITHPLPGRKLGVGEFMLVLETQIYGVSRDDIPPDPGMTGVDAIEAAYHKVSFQGILKQLKGLRRQLWNNREKPSVSRLLELTGEMEELVPKAMEELGFMLEKSAKIDKTIQERVK